MGFLRAPFRIALLMTVCISTAAIAQVNTLDLEELKARLPQAHVTADEGTVSQVYGRELARGDTPTESAASFLRNHCASLGLDESQLQNAGEYDVMGGKFRLFTYQQRVNGIPVYDRWVKVLVRGDNDHPTVLMNSSALPAVKLANARVAPVVGAAESVASARLDEPTAVKFSRPRLVYHESESTPLTLAWQFYGDNGLEADFNRWEFFVDAATGTVVDKRPGYYHADITGTVNGFQSPLPFADQANNPPASLPVIGARVRVIGGATTYADENGDFVIPHSGTTPVDVTVDFVGQWGTVNNVAGGGTVTATQSVTPPGPVNFVLNPTPTQQLTAQVNAMTHVTVVHDFIKSLNPSFTGFDISIPTNVNINDTCNAGYSPGNPTINFFLAGGGCPNTSYAGVIYHEYGHFIVDFSPGGPDTGDYHEGMSDVVSTLLLDDPCLGHDFFGQGSGCLRNVATSGRQFPCTGSGHFCGQVIAGAFWDMKNELVATEGHAVGLQLARDFYAGQIFSGNHQIAPSVVIDVLTLDDNDANLDNGTPHYNEICAGFEAHNLMCPALILFNFDYPQGRPELTSTANPTTIPVNISTFNAVPDPATATLFHRIGTTGTFTSSPMTHLGGDSYEVTLPSATCGETIQYYVRVDAQSGSTAFDPPNAPGAVYDALAAGGVIYEANLDFETAVGWTVSNDGGLTDGAWNRGIPVGGGVRGDPGTDFDGSGQCFLTDNASGNSDVDGGTTTLLSPIFDVSTLLEPEVVYARWYSNTQGDSPMADVFNIDVSSDGGSNWTALETVGPTGAEVAGGWFVKQFRVADFVPITSQFRIRFAASDLGAGSIVEAAIDSFELRDVSCESCDDGVLNQDEQRIDCGGSCPPCECTSDVECDDGAFCSGVETCDAFGVCQPGADPCNGFACDEGLGECLDCILFPFGDVNRDKSVDIFDILCVLDGFSQNFTNCTLEAVDVSPCTGDGSIDIFDILAVLDAFAGDAGGCDDPCITP